MQGPFYGLNAAAVRLLNDRVSDEQWEAAVAADRLDREDQITGALLEELGVPRLHCGHFVQNAAAYASSPSHQPTKGYGDHPKVRAGALLPLLVQPLTPSLSKPTEPITLHKTMKLGALRAHIPDSLCVANATADEDWTWRC